MTLPTSSSGRTTSTNLTLEEWAELDRLRRALSENLLAVHPRDQERFTDLLVRSWPARGDGFPQEQ